MGGVTEKRYPNLLDYYASYRYRTVGYRTGTTPESGKYGTVHKMKQFKDTWQRMDYQGNRQEKTVLRRWKKGLGLWEGGPQKISFFYLIASNSISLSLGEIQAVVLNMRNILLAVDEVEHERVLLVLTSLPAVPVVVAAAAAASRPGPVRHIPPP